MRVAIGGLSAGIECRDPQPVSVPLCFRRSASKLKASCHLWPFSQAVTVAHGVRFHFRLRHFAEEAQCELPSCFFSQAPVAALCK